MSDSKFISKNEFLSLLAMVAQSTWKDVKGYEGLYQVNPYGLVMALERTFKTKRGSRTYPSKIIAQVFSQNYYSVRLNNGNKITSYMVHRLVLEAFVGKRPDGMECRHLDGNTKNNRLSNLTWGTAQENSDDKIKHGTLAYGEKTGRARLKNKDVIYIKKMIKMGVFIPKTISKIFGIALRDVYRIKNGTRWGWLHV